VHQAKDERLPVVPAAAVLRTRDGVQVYLVDANNRVQVRKVELGPRVDTGYAVNAGLTDGELVIVSGLQKVKPGMTVKPSGAGGSDAVGAAANAASDADRRGGAGAGPDPDSDPEDAAGGSGVGPGGDAAGASAAPSGTGD
jgi:membrane fusion protein (multidrug efflux system)